MVNVDVKRASSSGQSLLEPGGQRSTGNGPEAIESSGPSGSRSRDSKLRRLRIYLSILIALWFAYKSIDNHIQCRVDPDEELTLSIMQEAIPPDIVVEQCTEWSDLAYQRRHSVHEPYSSVTSFELPFPSEKLFLLSRGVSGGTLEIVQSSDITEDDGIVKVEVVARYSQANALDYIRVCSVTREGDENGVGIFSIGRSKHIYVTFDVTVHLPRSSGSSQLYVKNFETDMPYFTHRISSLAETIDFDFVSFKTINRPIQVQSLRAINADLETINSPIEGRFEATSSLQLITMNAYINAHVHLSNDVDGEATYLTMSTQNGPIDATLFLSSTTTNASAIDFPTGGHFRVAAITQRGAIDVVLDHLPVDSTLVLNVHTSLSPATVQLHEAYEGRFFVQTTCDKPDIFVDRNKNDPTGENRKRFVEMKEPGVEGFVGDVRWGEEKEDFSKGNVHIESSFAPVRLRL